MATCCLRVWNTVILHCCTMLSIGWHNNDNNNLICIAHMVVTSDPIIVTVLRLSAHVRSCLIVSYFVAAGLWRRYEPTWWWGWARLLRPGTHAGLMLRPRHHSVMTVSPVLPTAESGSAHWLLLACICILVVIRVHGLSRETVCVRFVLLLFSGVCSVVVNDRSAHACLTVL